MAGDISVKLAVEGEKNFTSAIKAANAEIKNLDAQLKAAEAGFDDMTTSEEKAAAKTDLLKQKMEIIQQKADTLGKRYEDEKNKLNALGEALEKATAEYGENSIEATKASTAYNRQATEVSKLGKQLADTNKDMQAGEAELKELAKGAGEAGDEFSEAAKEMDTFRSVFWGDLAADAAENALGILKEIGKAAVDMVKDAVQGFADYEQLVGGVETLFGNSADKVEQYAQQAYQSAGLSANEYMETVTSFSASLLSSLGGDTAKAAEIADQAIVDMADNANKMGTSMESIQSAYQGFAKQNYTMLDNLKLGYGGTKSEMERLLDDAEQIKAAHGEMASYSIDSYADIVEAIHVVQTEMGITGTTAKEATETISGSIASAEAAFENFKTGLADENADIEQLAEDLAEGIVTAARNIVPVVQAAILGIGEAILDIPSALQAVHDRAILVQDTFAGTRARAQEARDAFAEASGAIGSESGTALALVTELYNLADGSNTSAAGQERLKAVVNELNSMIPNLGLEYDDLTGSINLTKDAVLDLIQAQINQEQIAALMEELSAIEQAHAEVEEHLAQARRDLVTATNELNAAQTDLDTQTTGNVTHDLELKDAVVEATDAYNDQVWYVQQLEQESAALDAEANGLAQQIADLGTSTVETSNANEELAETERELTEEEEAAAKAAEEAARAHEELVEALGGMPDILEAAGKSAEEMAELLESAGMTADDFAAGVEDVRDSIVNSFQEMKDNTEVTAESMIEVLTNNLSQQQEWSGNMHDLWDQTWGDEGAGGTVRAFLSYMQEQGPEYASVVEEWANGGYDQLVEAAQLWADAAEQSAADYTDGIAAKNAVAQESGQELAEAGNAGADAVDFQGTGDQKGQELASGIEGESGNVANAATQAVNQAHAQASTIKFNDVGYYISAGIATGIIQNATAVQNAARQVVQRAKEAAQSEAAIGSPSKVFADEVGYWITEGIASGLENASAIASVANAMRTVIASGLDIATEGTEKWVDAVWDAWTSAYDDRSRNGEFNLWYGLRFEDRDADWALGQYDDLIANTQAQIDDATQMGLDMSDEYVQGLYKDLYGYMEDRQDLIDDGVKAVEKAADAEKKAWKDGYDEVLKNRDHELFLMEMNGASDEAIAAFKQETRDYIAAMGQEARELGYWDDYGMGLQKDWWGEETDIREYADEMANAWKDEFESDMDAWDWQIWKAEDAGASAKDIIKIYAGAVDRIDQQIAAARERGLDESDEYVQELIKQRSSYSGKMQDIYDDEVESYEKFLRSLESSYDDYNRSYMNKVEKALTDWKNGLDQTMQQIQQKQDQMTSKLQGYGDLATFYQSYDGNGSYAWLGSSQSSQNTLRTIEKYGSLLDEVSGMGIPDFLMERILGLGIDDAVAYMTALTKMSSGQRASYLNTWSKIGETSERISARYYQGDKDAAQASADEELAGIVQSLAEEYGPGLQAIFEGIEVDASETGLDAARAFAESFASAAPEVYDSVRDTIKNALGKYYSEDIFGVNVADLFDPSEAFRTGYAIPEVKIAQATAGGRYIDSLLTPSGGEQALIQAGMATSDTVTPADQLEATETAIAGATSTLEALLAQIVANTDGVTEVTIALDGTSMAKAGLPFIIREADAVGTPIVNVKTY